MMSLSSSLAEIVNGLETSNGVTFNEWVAKSFEYLFFNAEVIEDTQSESDVIAEALFAQEPYFVVIEAQAVLDHNEVGYDKLGQLRGNFPSYMDERRQKIFENAYKLVVGRPKFSRDARKRATPDVVLISVKTLKVLLELHTKYRFSQDDIELLFKKDTDLVWGEIDERLLTRIFTNPFRRKVELNALVMLCLGGSSLKREWIPIEQVVGLAKGYGRFLSLSPIRDNEIKTAINDLQSSLIRLIATRTHENVDQMRLQSIPLESINALLPCGRELHDQIITFSEQLKKLEKVAS